VLEHGDLSHPNLFLDGEKRSLNVIDWERAALDGIPGRDLVFFLQYLAECRVMAGDRVERCRAFDDAFDADGGWARPALAAELSRRGVASELLGALVVAGWARTAGTLAARLRVDGEATGESAALAATLATNREVQLWHHAVLRAEEGRVL
jgi:aminoglycoside phosphotransferase (APT) family kinase protein